MDKRSFLKTLGMGTALLPFQAGAFDQPVGRKGKLYPQKLRQGDTIGIICPSSAVFEELAYQLAEETFEAMGFRVKWGRHCRSRYGHLAGRDEEKLADIHAMFADRQVKAIVCLRGGEGAARLLDKLDYALIANNPKIFLGYSDITALHSAIYTKTGLITFHGPVGISSWPNYVVEQFKSLFMEGNKPNYVNPDSKGDGLIARENRIQTIKGGKARGLLLGGNLTVLASLAGSAYYPDFKDAILFLEEVDETPERVERLFGQLRLSGALAHIKGFVFGQCTDCTPGKGYGSLTIDEILHDYIDPLGIPSYFGALIGHIKEQFILPVGAEVEMDADKGSIAVLENIFNG